MRKPGISQIENAFQPAKEIATSERFAGRKDAVADAYYGLIAEGAHMAIVGNRGIGKTSLARQVLNMANGDNSLLDKLAISSDRNLDFLSVYFACGTSTTNTSDLLERLLTSSNCLAEWLYDIPKASKEIRGYNPKLGANVFGIEASLGAEKKKEVTTESVLSSHPIDTIFTNALSAVVEQNLSEDGILIVIDEFDQINDPSGFASFLKALSTNVPKVKFCIVGVAQDIQYLMKEHQSSDRLFAGTIIQLPSMSKSELSEIVSIAEQSVDHYLKFSVEATERIAELAQGHPYMVHLMGSLEHLDGKSG